MKANHNRFERREKMEVLKYEISSDKKGLRKYCQVTKGRIGFYHIHSNELSKLEKWILELLKRKMR